VRAQDSQQAVSYDDFTILIGSRQGDELSVRAEWSGARVNERIRFPMIDRIDETLDAVGAALHGAAPAFDWARGPILPGSTGRQLFNTLFTGRIGSLFSQSLGPRRPVRIRLQMDLEDPAIVPLASLPWELMVAADGEELALAYNKTIVRCPDISRPVSIPPFRPPLRVLFVMANPRGDLDLGEERRRIEAALAEEKAGVHTQFLENATYAGLEELLRRFDFHAVHFMGHGDFRDGEGVLLFQDGAYRGRDVAVLMRRERETRLVFLNACRTAQVTRVHGQDPFAGVATSLLMADMPAVVAMQFPVSDRAAIEFAARFYAEIARSKSVEEAVDSGRMKIRAGAPDKYEWATPVLFLRSHGDLFALQQTARTVRKTDDDRDLLVYMLDRVPIVFELRNAIARHNERRDAPLVAIIHGNDAQCHDKLLERLATHELPELLDFDTHEQNGIKQLHLAWPTQARNAEEFRQQLLFALAQRVRDIGRKVPPNAEDIHQVLLAFPAPIMIYTQVLAAELESHTRWDPLHEYLEFWNSWPRISSSQRILVFPCIKYRTVSESHGWDFLKRRQVARSTERIGAALQSLAAKHLDGIVLKVLPELGEVTEQDVQNWAGDWAMDYGYQHLDDDIRALFRDYEQRTRRNTIPMQEITRMLQKLLAERRTVEEGVA
jgi:hypothetical protein